MTRRLAGLAFLCLAALARGEDSLEDRFRAVLARFADESWAVRDQAEQDIVALGPEVRPLIEKELEATKDAETRMRLRNALGEIGKPRWATGFKAAQEQAARSGRPIFVVCADGPLETAKSRAGEALRRELAKPELANELNSRFVLLWWNSGVEGAPDDRDPKAEPAEEGDTGPTGCIGIYVCTARGVVRHFLPGWWTAETLREDMDRLKAVFAAPDAGEASKARTTIARQHEAAVERKAADNPDEMARPPGDSEIRRDVERQRRVLAAWAAGAEVVGESNADAFLKRRLHELNLRWNAGGQPRR
jgi:hypothetical protein